METNSTNLVSGLGVMGYPMALNLHAGLGSDQILLICDTNLEALDRFKAEARGKATVKIVSNGFEAAKAAVRNISSLLK